MELLDNKAGYLVYTADSARKALELLSVTPNLILLDINMPKKNGLDFCQLIREHVSCPIIFLTAKVEEQDVIKGLSVGGDDYFLKMQEWFLIEGLCMKNCGGMSMREIAL